MTLVNGIQPVCVAMSDGSGSRAQEEKEVDIFENITEEGKQYAQSFLSSNASDIEGLLDENGLITTDIDKLEELLFSGNEHIKMSSNNAGQIKLCYDSDGDGSSDRILTFSFDDETGEMLKKHESIYTGDERMDFDFFDNEVADMSYRNYLDRVYYSENTALNASNEVVGYGPGHPSEYTLVDGTVISFEDVFRFVDTSGRNYIHEFFEFTNGDSVVSYDPNTSSIAFNDEYVHWRYAQTDNEETNN